ncbi:hypothetical protein DdX_10826 [Ditylenchus destructor]|uniref:Uncharacterized protein n=1 Tax=Ditylenchus destructor TaxID=166010 RepID=A0AAD4MZW2_9BILA|nr:hypothetical protein DdX_10826 [Ditylenchus destructor]
MGNIISYIFDINPTQNSFDRPKFRNCPVIVSPENLREVLTFLTRPELEIATLASGRFYEIVQRYFPDSPYRLLQHVLINFCAPNWPTHLSDFKMGPLQDFVAKLQCRTTRAEWIILVFPPVQIGKIKKCLTSMSHLWSSGILEIGFRHRLDDETISEYESTISELFQNDSPFKCSRLRLCLSGVPTLFTGNIITKIPLFDLCSWLELSGFEHCQSASDVAILLNNSQNGSQLTLELGRMEKERRNIVFQFTDFVENVLQDFTNATTDRAYLLTVENIADRDLVQLQDKCVSNTTTGEQLECRLSEKNYVLKRYKI